MILTILLYTMRFTYQVFNTVENAYEVESVSTSTGTPAEVMNVRLNFDPSKQTIIALQATIVPTKICMAYSIFSAAEIRNEAFTFAMAYFHLVASFLLHLS